MSSIEDSKKPGEGQQDLAGTCGCGGKKHGGSHQQGQHCCGGKGHDHEPGHECCGGKGHGHGKGHGGCGCH